MQPPRVPAIACGGFHRRKLHCHAFPSWCCKKNMHAKCYQARTTDGTLSRCSGEPNAYIGYITRELWTLSTLLYPLSTLSIALWGAAAITIASVTTEFAASNGRTVRRDLPEERLAREHAHNKTLRGASDCCAVCVYRASSTDSDRNDCTRERHTPLQQLVASPSVRTTHLGFEGVAAAMRQNAATTSSSRQSPMR